MPPIFSPIAPHFQSLDWAHIWDLNAAPHFQPHCPSFSAPLRPIFSPRTAPHFGISALRPIFSPTTVPKFGISALPPIFSPTAPHFQSLNWAHIWDLSAAPHFQPHCPPFWDLSFLLWGGGENGGGGGLRGGGKKRCAPFSAPLRPILGSQSCPPFSAPLRPIFSQTPPIFSPTAPHFQSLEWAEIWDLRAAPHFQPHCAPFSAPLPPILGSQLPPVGGGGEKMAERGG